MEGGVDIAGDDVGGEGVTDGGGVAGGEGEASFSACNILTASGVPQRLQN